MELVLLGLRAKGHRFGQLEGNPDSIRDPMMDPRDPLRTNDVIITTGSRYCMHTGSLRVR